MTLQNSESGLAGSETGGNRVLPEVAVDVPDSVVMMGMSLHHHPRHVLHLSETCQSFAAPLPPLPHGSFLAPLKELTGEHNTVLRVTGIPCLKRI